MPVGMNRRSERERAIAVVDGEIAVGEDWAADGRRVAAIEGRIVAAGADDPHFVREARTPCGEMDLRTTVVSGTGAVVHHLDRPRPERLDAAGDHDDPSQLQPRAARVSGDSTKVHVARSPLHDLPRAGKLDIVVEGGRVLDGEAGGADIERLLLKVDGLRELYGVAGSRTVRRRAALVGARPVGRRRERAGTRATPRERVAPRGSRRNERTTHDKGFPQCLFRIFFNHADPKPFCP